MTTPLREMIITLWNRQEMTQAEIAREVGCSGTYVNKVLHGRDDDWQQTGPELVYQPITRAQVVEGYFAWPHLASPAELAKVYRADPAKVGQICRALRLPFRGQLWPEDRVG